MHRPIRTGLVALAVVAAGLVPLSAAEGSAFPGANGLIAFTCGVTTVCTVNADGTNKQVLLTNASDPSWSADGTQIAFVDTVNGVSVANADGTGKQALGAGAGSVQPSFSFDGIRVAHAKTNDIFSILASTGGSEQNLTNSAALDADPAFSPDGTKIAFASNAGSGYDIWTLQVSNPASLVHVTTVAGDERGPTWSPSGDTIVYSSAGELFAVSSAGGGTPQDLLVQGTNPAFSPDGTKIAFINAAGHLAEMTATAGATPQVLDALTVDSQPDWQAVAPPPPQPPPFAGPPSNVSYPTINLASGDSVPTMGHFLTASVGTWGGSFPITYTYQWKRCDAADPVNGPCVNIAGATSSFYTPPAADFGQRLRVAVTATNSQGTATQNSEVSAPVTAFAPKLRATPQIQGDNRVETTLTLTAGAWDGSTPITFVYSWRRCNPVGDLATCVQIPGATTATYAPSVQDIGFSIRVWITGTNPAGSDVAITNHTFPVLDKLHFAPQTILKPTIAGTVAPGRQLTANIGSFNGDLPITTAFVWQRCDATGGACHYIGGAKKVVYFPNAADVGYTLRLGVTATNAYGVLVAQSDPTEAVAGQPPHRPGRYLVGTSRGDYLAGGGYDDVIFGLGGNDTLLGGAGDDRIHGGPGNDVITGGRGADRLFGGPGSDTIYAADGERDIVNCGPGRDRAIVDSFDRVTNCEVVVSGPVAATR